MSVHKLTVELLDDPDCEFFSILRVTHNGTIVREERDGGEPEDQFFWRNWSWVPDAIRQAYLLGLKDGGG